MDQESTPAELLQAAKEYEIAAKMKAGEEAYEKAYSKFYLQGRNPSVALTKEALEAFAADQSGGKAVAAWELGDQELAGKMTKHRPAFERAAASAVSKSAGRVSDAPMRLRAGVAFAGGGVITFLAPELIAARSHELARLVNHPEEAIQLATQSPREFCEIVHVRAKDAKQNAKIDFLRSLVMKRALEHIEKTNQQQKISQEISKRKFDEAPQSKADATQVHRVLKVSGNSAY